jgi:hypothetical protein
MKQKSFDMPSNVDFDGPTNVSHLTELNPLNYSHLFDASATSSLIGLPSSTSFGNFNTFTDPLNSMRTCVDHRNLERLPIFLPSPNSILPRISANSNASYQIYQQNAVTNNAWHPAAYQQKASSCTPDSGIQSIDGSPPSVSSYTPPLVSPYTSQMASCESVSTLPIPQSSVIQQLPIPTSSAVLEVPIDHMLPNMSSEDERRIQHIDTASNNNDLSDMPRLKPFIVEYAEQHDSLGTANTPLFPCPLTDSSIRDKQPLTRESDSMAQTEVVDSIIKTNVRVESPATSTYDLHLANESRNCPDILQLEHYRKKVQQQLNQQLLDIFESVLKKFDGLHIGSRLEHTNKSGFHSQITLRISKKHRNFPYKQITCEKKPNCMSTLEKRLGSTKYVRSFDYYCLVSYCLDQKSRHQNIHLPPRKFLRIMEVLQKQRVPSL